MHSSTQMAQVSPPQPIFIPTEVSTLHNLLPHTIHAAFGDCLTINKQQINSTLFLLFRIVQIKLIYCIAREDVQCRHNADMHGFIGQLLILMHIVTPFSIKRLLHTNQLLCKFKPLVSSIQAFFLTSCAYRKTFLSSEQRSHILTNNFLCFQCYVPTFAVWSTRA